MRPGRNDIEVVALDELESRDALLLFRERLVRDGLEQETDQDLQRLYAVVGGNPLALEWIVGQLREGSELPGILHLLQDGKADILPRVFEQSWNSLQRAAQAILCSMSVFVTPTLETSLRATTGLSAAEFKTGLQHWWSSHWRASRSETGSR